MVREDRHLTSDGCSSTLSIAKTSGKALCAPIIIIQYIHNVVYIFQLLPTFNVTTNYMSVEFFHPQGCVMEDPFPILLQLNKVIKKVYE